MNSFFKYPLEKHISMVNIVLILKHIYHALLSHHFFVIYTLPSLKYQMIFSHFRCIFKISRIIFRKWPFVISSLFEGFLHQYSFSLFLQILIFWVILKELIKHKRLKLLIVKGNAFDLSKPLLKSLFVVIIILNGGIEACNIVVLWLYLVCSSLDRGSSVSLKNGGNFISEIIFSILIGLFFGVMQTLEKGEDFRENVQIEV